MWIFVSHRSGQRVRCALVLAALTFVTGLERYRGAFADEKTVNPPATKDRTVRFLNEVRPILAQHCFQCHGPDEAARKGKLRLDLKENAFAERDSKYVIAPGNLRWLTRLGADHDR